MTLRSDSPLEAALDVLRRDTAAVAAYVFGWFALALLPLLSSRALGLHPGMDPLPSWMNLYSTAVDVALVVGGSALQTACFTAIGRSMDKPLWKIESLREGFGRFFPLWLCVNLLLFLLVRAHLASARLDSGDLAAFMELILLFAILLLPAGAACIMYQGRFAFARIEEALAPLVRFPMLTLQALLFPFAVYILHAITMLGGLGLSPLGICAMQMPIALLEVLGFAAIWRICMHYRDHGHNVDDPYDF